MLEYKNSLNDLEWIPLEAFFGNGTVRSFSDQNASLHQRFYRVRMIR